MAKAPQEQPRSGRGLAARDPVGRFGPAGPSLGIELAARGPGHEPAREAPTARCVCRA